MVPAVERDAITDADPSLPHIVAAARISRARSAYERGVSAATSAMLEGERAARRSIQVPRPANPIG